MARHSAGIGGPKRRADGFAVHESEHWLRVRAGAARRGRTVGSCVFVTDDTSDRALAASASARRWTRSSPGACAKLEAKRMDALGAPIGARLYSFSCLPGGRAPVTRARETDSKSHPEAHVVQTCAPCIAKERRTPTNRTAALRPRHGKDRIRRPPGRLVGAFHRGRLVCSHVGGEKSCRPV